MAELRQRLLAGIWFAVAALIPVAFYFLLLREGERTQFNSYFLFLCTPVLIAGISGFALGYSILDPSEIKSTGQAMLRGVMVALLSYLLFFMASALILAVSNKGASTDGDAGFLIGWTIIFFYGFITVGWLIAITGLVGGWLLYLYRLKRFASQDFRRNPTSN